MHIAMEILNDCRAAQRHLEDIDDPAIRRILWAGLITSLRAIGDVLDRDDSKSVRSNYQAAAKEWVDEETGDPVWKEFIRAERNQVVHEFRFGHSEGPQLVLVDKIGESPLFELESDVYWPMEVGPFAGMDARDAITEAILWWEKNLKKILPNSP